MIAEKISFKTNGATSSGFTNLPEHESRFGRSERELVRILAGMRSIEESNTLSFHLEGDDMPLVRRLSDLRIYFPGGPCTLPSFGQVQYAAFGEEEDSIPTAEKSLAGPHELMHAAVPAPMMPLPPTNIFTSAKQAAVHLAYAARTVQQEEEVALHLWAQRLHEATLFQLEHYDTPILAVNFNPAFERLGDGWEETTFHLPHELTAEALFDGDEANEKENSKKARSRKLSLVLEEVPGLPRHDAYFLVCNPHAFKWLDRVMNLRCHSADGKTPQYRKIQIKPQLRKFTFTSHMDTCASLQAVNHKWTTQLLNQDTSVLRDADLTKRCSMANVRIADDWLLRWKPWNLEQREVLANIHQAKGKMVIVKGIAGTGKTLLQSAISLYFARLGYKVLVTPPSNSNASHTAYELNASNAEKVSMLRDSDDASADEDYLMDRTVTPNATTPTIRRLFSGALSFGAEDMFAEIANERYRQTDFAQDVETAQDQPQRRRQGPSAALLSFESTLHNIKNRKSGGREYSVEQAIIDEAEKGQFKLYSSEVKRIEKGAELWGVLRDYIKASRDGTLDRNAQNAMEEYEEAFRLCKSHLVASTHILITTTGNARCADILHYWLDSVAKYKIPYKGVIVMCDEAFKDTELGTWNSIMAPEGETKAVFMFGDELQLAPTNTASDGKLVFGQYTKQLDIALPHRLVKEGYPYVFLREQQRMHPCISKFPNAEFYDGRLRDGPRVRMTLEEEGATCMRGLSKVLHGILQKSRTTPAEAADYWENRTDEQARHAYIEVDGMRQKGPGGVSSYVPEHIEVFFKQIFPDLQAFWGVETSKNLMIICAYRHAVSTYATCAIEANTDTSFLAARVQSRHRGSASEANASGHLLPNRRAGTRVFNQQRSGVRLSLRHRRCIKLRAIADGLTQAQPRRRVHQMLHH